MSERVWKVGELAAECQISVRTLHYYDEIGLLRPSVRSGSGHRLYTHADVVRLQQIKSLRQLGFSLDDIRATLANPECSPLRIVEMHLGRLRAQLERQQRLCAQLESLAEHLRSRGDADCETFIQVIQEIEMLEKYYTPEQLTALERRRVEVGDKRIREVEQEWNRLFLELRALKDAGIDPADAQVRPLAERAKALVAEFTGGNAGITKSLGRLHQENPDYAARHGAPVDKELMNFLGEAMAAVGG